MDTILEDLLVADDPAHTFEQVLIKIDAMHKVAKHEFSIAVAKRSRVFEDDLSSESELEEVNIAYARAEAKLSVTHHLVQKVTK